MKIIDYDNQLLNNYLENLKIVGSISALFSDSDIPMLYYRATENLYCDAFGAQNLSRSDVTADAKYNNYGIGIKTFLENNKKTYQKVAEFNSHQSQYVSLEPLEKINKIAELRNKRIQFTMDAFDIDTMIYHCIVRNNGGFHLFEESMDFININKIKLTKISNNTIAFEDGIHNYRFNTSKSTLYKQFFTNNYFASINVEIAVNPLSIIQKQEYSLSNKEVYQSIILPLYSSKKGISFVPERSGLNQWNAKGRVRDKNEVYIPYPAKVRHAYPDFFPDRTQNFDVELPNGKILSMKVCQDNDKAIMSNPNKELGHWILREVLNLENEELLTYELLNEIGVDSVSFTKTNNVYKLNFKKLGSYEEFIENILK